MSKYNCIHIVPALWPGRDEVGDYALKAAHQLSGAAGASNKFIVCDPDWHGPSALQGFPVRRLRQMGEAGLWGLLASMRDKENPTMAILHYDHLRYDPRGTPTWMYKGIRSWIQETQYQRTLPNRSLTTVFHGAHGGEYQSQGRGLLTRLGLRRLIAKLHRLSTVSVTNSRRMSAKLDRIEPGKTVFLPTPSNSTLLEGDETLRQRRTELRVIIPGSGQARLAAVRSHQKLLSRLDSMGNLSSVVLLSTPGTDTRKGQSDLEMLKKCVPPNRIEIRDSVTQQEFYRELGHGDMFLANGNPPSANALMTALAAKCVGVFQNAEYLEPLEEDEHFLVSDDSDANIKRLFGRVETGDLERVAEAGRAWYERNADWSVAAEEFRQIVSNPRRWQRASILPKERATSWHAQLYEEEALV